MILILFYFVLNSRVMKLNALIESVLVIPDAWILCLHHVSLTQLFYNIMQIFSLALSLPCMLSVIALSVLPIKVSEP